MIKNLFRFPIERYARPFWMIAVLLVGGLLPAEAWSQRDAAVTKKVRDYAFRPHFELGIEAGTAFTACDLNTHYAHDYVYEDAVGANLGLSLLWQPQDWFGLRADIAWTQKPVYQRRVQQANMMYLQIMENGYLQVPVTADFSFGGEKWRGHFNLGLYFAYWMQSDVMGMYEGIDDGREAFYIYDYYEPYEFDPRRDNRFDVGYAASVGLSRRVGSHLRLQAELALYYGLRSRFVESAVAPDPLYYTTKSFNLGAYWMF